MKSAFGLLSFLLILSSCKTAPLHNEKPLNELPFLNTIPSHCSSFQQVGFSHLIQINGLPNPFNFRSGNPFSKKSDWTCRRQEIGELTQTFSLGIKPDKPEKVSSELTSDELIIHVQHQNKKIKFSAKIIWPKTGKAPYPAIIGMGGSWINNEEILNQGVALITFPNNDVAEQLNSSSRGKGKFYDLYGSSHSAGALMAWAWGVSRLIDGLENQNQINIHRLGITGCSRNGKGALVAGAFDQRIRLTIPQESGAGGSTSWRVSEMQLARGQNVQTLRQIVQENAWLTDQFKQFSESVNLLPFDQHLLIGMLAPRAILLIENTSMEWLGNESTYVSALASKEIWKALDIKDRFGFSQQGGHNHCQLPPEQAVEINAFIQKFLLDNNAGQTNIFHTDGNFSPDLKSWINWSTPELK